VPRQRSLGRGIIEVTRNDVHMEVRDDITEQLVVDMTRLANAFDGASDILNVQPIISEFVRSKICEGRDMSTPKHHCRVAGRDSMAFEKSFADSAAVERSAGQIGTEGASDTLLARFPVLRPGSCHATAPF